MEVRLRDEFKLSNFKLTFHNEEVFGSSQWRWPGPVFVVYRLVAASYVIGWNVYGYITIPTFGHHVTIVFYTNWCYLVLGLHLTIALFVTLYQATRRRKEPPETQVVRPAAQAGTGSSHVIAICSGVQCAGLPGGIVHYHISECAPDPHMAAPQQPGVGRAQRKSKRRSGCHGEDSHDACGAAAAGIDSQMACNGGSRGSGVKARSTGRTDSHRVKDDLKEPPRSSRSVGVSCAMPSKHRTKHDQSKRTAVGTGSAPTQASAFRARLVVPVGGESGCGGRGLSNTPDQPRQKVPPRTPLEGATAGEDVRYYPGGDDRKQRRRARHTRVYHRAGKGSTFRCRSSTSSLDKVRTRGRRLSPEVKRSKRRRSPRSSARVDATAGVAGLGGCACRVGGRGEVMVAGDDAGYYLEEETEVAGRERRRRHRSRRGSGHHRRLRHSDGLHATGQVLPLPAGPEGDQAIGRCKHTFILHGGRAVARRKGSPRSTSWQPEVRARTSGEAEREALGPSEATRTKLKSRAGGEARATAATAAPASATGANGGVGKRGTRSVGTNTSPTPLLHRISLIVDPPPPVPAAGAVAVSGHVAASQPEATPVSAPADPSATSGGGGDLPLYAKVSWAVFNMAVVSAPVVSSVYFFVLFPMLQREQPSFRAGVLDLNLHGVNSLIALLEVAISAFPVRLLHAVFPMAYGLSYAVFSLAYWGLDKQNNVLYPVILDWNRPGVAAAVVGALVLLATPFFQLALYGVYRARLYLSEKACCQKTSCNSSSGGSRTTAANRTQARTQEQEAEGGQEGEQVNPTRHETQV